MRTHFWLNTFLAAALLISAGLSAAEAAPWQQTNLLANGGFEAGGGSTGAANWLPWWSEEAKPSDGSYNYAYKPSWNTESLASGANSFFIYSGSASQRIINSWDPWYAGVKQVATAPAGSTVKLTVYAKLRAASAFFPAPSESSAGGWVRVGLEPGGTDNQFAPGVVWSSAISPHDTWSAVSIEAVVGASGKIGVFLAASYRGSSRQSLEAYFDEASLVVVGAGAAPTAAPGATSAPGGQPTAAPVVLTPFTMPTAGPDGNIIYIVQPGDSLWRVAVLANVTLDQIRAWNGLTTDILSVGQSLIIGQSTPSVQPTATLDPNAPAASPTAPAAELTAEPTAAPSLPSGTVCAMMYEDVNGNTRRDAEENLVAGGQFSVVDTATGAPVQAYTTDGINEPHCFENLPAGAYTFSSAAPQGYNATTSGSTQLQLEAGSLSNIEFGVQRSGNTALATETPAAGGNSRLRTALFGAAGVMFLLLAAGFAGFLFLRRPR